MLFIHFDKGMIGILSLAIISYISICKRVVNLCMSSRLGILLVGVFSPSRQGCYSIYFSTFQGYFFEVGNQHGGPWGSILNFSLQNLNLPAPCQRKENTYPLGMPLKKICHEKNAPPYRQVKNTSPLSGFRKVVTPDQP